MKKKASKKNMALKILAELNALIRGKDFADMVLTKEYERLHGNILSLGWVTLADEMNVNKKGKFNELQVQLKLASTDSKEARRLFVHE